jgi:hypothetical protein
MNLFVECMRIHQRHKAARACVRACVRAGRGRGVVVTVSATQIFMKLVRRVSDREDGVEWSGVEWSGVEWSGDVAIWSLNRIPCSVFVSKRDVAGCVCCIVGESTVKSSTAVKSERLLY